MADIGVSGVRLALEQITAWGLEPAAFIDLAATLECEAISLFVEAPVPESAGPPLTTDAGLRHDIRARLDDSGVRLQTIECFALAAETDVAAFAPALAAGAELGGSMATAIVFDPDRARVVDRLGELGALAASFGIAVNAEFIAMSALGNLADAVALVREVGTPGMGVVLDSLHWTRSGGLAADIHAVPQDLIGHVQFCDGPRDMPAELQLFHEGFLQRKMPGEGDFALADFVRALPLGRLVGVEVPLQDLADRGVPVEERARRAVAASRAFLERHGYEG